MRISDWSSDVCSSDLYGSARPEDLPFDMRHLRAPLLYHLEAEADPAATRRAKEKLTRELANRLKVYLKAVPVEAVTQKLYVPEDFGPNAVAPLLGRVTVVGTEIDDYQGRSIDKIGRASWRERVCQYV